MNPHSKRLRQTRADMLGTDDEEHYWDCHSAAKYIDALVKAGCGYNDCYNKEAFMAGVHVGLDTAFNKGAPEPEDAYKKWKVTQTLPPTGSGYRGERE